MNWALENPDDLQFFKEKAQMIVRETYDWERVTDAYEGLFSRMLGKMPEHHYPR